MKRRMRKGKKLLQFMLSEKGLAVIDELKERTEAASRAEVIRTAITFLWWGTEHIKGGREIVVIRSGDQVIEETVPLWELQSIGQSSPQKRKAYIEKDKSPGKEKVLVG
ncbi:hypothetical protein ES702_00844 [subsurface metagenome]